MCVESLDVAWVCLTAESAMDVLENSASHQFKNKDSNAPLDQHDSTMINSDPYTFLLRTRGQRQRAVGKQILLTIQLDLFAANAPVPLTGKTYENTHL